MRSVCNGCFCLVVLLASASVADDEYYSLGEIYDMGVDAVEKTLPPGALGDYELMRSSDWNQFWSRTAGALGSQSLEDLDWLMPYVKDAIPTLRALPNGDVSADWLQQRLDFFEAADEAIERVPAPVQPPSPPPPERRVRVIVPPPRPPSPPPPPAVQKKRVETVRSRETWEKKLSGRKAPANAADLVPSLKAIFREEGVPEQLVWLAEVESSLNPKARSPVGAVGLFQFMPATAKRFGMKTSPVDQRTNPEQSARAAARYLRTLHKQFNSWPLAFAAYNAGEGRVGRLLKDRSDKTFESIADSLPMETQMYVPKVLAMISLREGIDASKLSAPEA